MKKAVAVIALIWILIVAAQASVTFTPPGSSKPMVGNTFTMMPSDRGKEDGLRRKSPGWNEQGQENVDGGCHCDEGA